MEPGAQVGEQQIFHLTHEGNLASIVAEKQLFADTNPDWEERPAVDLAAEATRLARRARHTGHHDDSVVADFVPFSLRPDSRQLRGLVPRAGLVLLVSSIASVLDWQTTAHPAHTPKMLFTNMDAAVPGAEFGRTREQLASLVRMLFSPATAPAHVEESRAAEFLVQGFFPLRRVLSIGVPSEEAATRVRAVLADRSATIDVLVRPEWFRAD
ncbi:DarT ssDNA thymidine ADP-ribosyltransferase family protein [Cryobacterium psychrophilum]|uniref:DarT ssDNA thymidine ADP-ribosyltransferase family protein n=1 Tax=Cryobacterium psychrophilum TaxID=41988 RepID=UPI003BAE708D